MHNNRFWHSRNTHSIANIQAQIRSQNECQIIIYGVNVALRICIPVEWLLYVILFENKKNVYVHIAIGRLNKNIIRRRVQYIGFSRYSISIRHALFNPGKDWHANDHPRTRTRTGLLPTLKCHRFFFYSPPISNTDQIDTMQFNVNDHANNSRIANNSSEHMHNKINVEYQCYRMCAGADRQATNAQAALNGIWLRWFGGGGEQRIILNILI